MGQKIHPIIHQTSHFDNLADNSEKGEAFIHRDLSWLQFNERVLSEAFLETNPLLERVKFLAITSSNLDEFFMIRFASLVRSIMARRQGRENISKLLEMRSLILDSVYKFNLRQADALDALKQELATHGISISCEASNHPTELGKKIFNEKVLPLLGKPEPFTPSKLFQLENLKLAAIFQKPVWLKISRTLPSMYFAQTQGQLYCYFLDDLLLAYLGDAFEIDGGVGVIRLTRDGDFTADLVEEDPESIPDVVRSSLKRREKGRPTRLQYVGELSDEFLARCRTILRMHSTQVCRIPHTLCLQGLWSVVNYLPESVRVEKKLSHPPLKSVLPKPFLSPDTLFDAIGKQDCFLHHPYDSFDAFVEWIRAACRDPKVVSIEQTVYRMDASSPVIEELKKAAKFKKVRVIIELRARFDELNNLRLAEELEKAGVEVSFGFGNLKLHAKVALVTRLEEGVLKTYTHLSTGNYNATTARQYTDMAILTANPEIGHDARIFFDAIVRGETPCGFKKLVPAPTKLHRKIQSLIESEIKSAQRGEPARIIAKVNALVEKNIIQSLYSASQAGVKIDLIVRGACSLVPGVPGLSENIRVISIVDRFLEHSRIYYFESSRIMYLSSADWMRRNFFSRLELAFPVLDDQIFNYLKTVVLPAYLSDTVKARELNSRGIWAKRAGNIPKSAQFFFEELAASSVKTPLA